MVVVILEFVVSAGSELFAVGKPCVAILAIATVWPIVNLYEWLMVVMYSVVVVAREVVVASHAYFLYDCIPCYQHHLCKG